nr:MAG TPA: capsid protein [Circoviridae sp.]
MPKRGREDDNEGESRVMKRVKQVGNVALTARRALDLAMTIKKIVNVEKKVWPDTPYAGAVITTTANFFNPCKIAEGLTFNGRSGRSIKAISFQIRGLAYFNVAATRSVLRVVCFIDNAYDGATPVITDLYLGTPVVNALRAIDPNDKSRYRVLMDKRLWLNATEPVQLFEFYKKMQHTIKYDGSAATDYAHGTLWMMAISDEATNGPALQLETALRFVDN